MIFSENWLPLFGIMLEPKTAVCDSFVTCFIEAGSSAG
jgi:hypothetical protein